MTFRAERCWGSEHYFRVSLGWRGSDKMWHHIANPDGGSWSRSHAIESMDYLSYHHGIKRRNIRYFIP